MNRIALVLPALMITLSLPVVAQTAPVYFTRRAAMPATGPVDSSLPALKNARLQAAINWYDAAEVCLTCPLGRRVPA